MVGAVVLLAVAKSSDYFRERTFHIVFSLTLSLVGMVVLSTIDVLTNKGVAYFACFLMAAGAYIPSCLVHAWHNNNNVHENSRAANTGFFVGLGNLAGIMSAATFRTEYAPQYEISPAPSRRETDPTGTYRPWWLPAAVTEYASYSQSDWGCGCAGRTADAIENRGSDCAERRSTRDTW